jgi:hypothetical protein
MGFGTNGPPVAFSGLRRWKLHNTVTLVSEAKSMRTLVLSTAVIAGVVWIGIAPANAAPPSMSGIGKTNIEVGTVKNVGYWRRYYRRYGYPVPYAYYPPAYGYDVPPAAYTYPLRPAMLRLRETITSTLHLRKATTTTRATTVMVNPRKATMPALRPQKVTNRTTAIRIRLMSASGT